MYKLLVYRVFSLWLLLLGGCLRCEAQFFESSVIAYGAAAVGAAVFAGFGQLSCQFKECCLPKSSWVTPNLTLLHHSLEDRVHGQHLIKDVVVRALLSHYDDPQPRKALVISLHGDTGTGKNFVSDIITEALYKKGTNSKYVHKFIASVEYLHESKTDIYKLELIDKIRAAVSSCERSLFIFDEVHKLPMGLIDSIKPFIDHHQDIQGVDYRKSVFLFLSNTGTSDILRFVLDWWSQGKTRADITLHDMEELVRKGAFNEKGGLHRSELIQHSLVDYYVPFLPLERRHIELCARDDLQLRRKQLDDNIVRQVADEVTYRPVDNPLFASKGCKNVHQKVGFLLTNFGRY